MHRTESFVKFIELCVGSDDKSQNSIGRLITARVAMPGGASAAGGTKNALRRARRIATA